MPPPRPDLASNSGDSGSGVLNEQSELAGLLFAGGPRQTLLNPIQSVIREIRRQSRIASLEVVTV